MSAAPARPRITRPPEEEIGLVQGIYPDSRNEWHFALACDKLRLDYNFQYPIGPIGARGSQWIDFVVYVPPSRKACFIQGAYWHNRRSQIEDQIKHAAAERYFGPGNVVDFSEEETSSVEAAVRAIRRKLL